MLNILSRTVQAARTTSLRIASPYRKALRDIPPQLYEYWARTAHHEFKGIPRDAFFYARASEALLAFFDCVARSNRPCALPSMAADSVWHAWLRHDPAALDAFCERHFGRRIPHVEAADMDDGMALPMAMSLVTARTMDGLKLAGPDVPRLFATDRLLRMPGGFAYMVRGNRMVCSRMNRKGEAWAPAQVVPGTAPDFLLAAGLIGQGDFDLWLHNGGAVARSGAVGDGADLALQACDTACTMACDSAGSDGGGSCGSTCGGGCGGGGCGS